MDVVEIKKTLDQIELQGSFTFGDINYQRLTYFGIPSTILKQIVTVLELKISVLEYLYLFRKKI